jgi:hypothetical protein
MVATQTPRQLERRVALQREKRRVELGLTAEQYEALLEDRPGLYSLSGQKREEEAEKAAQVWLEGQRIEKHLPQLYRQRQEAEQLVADLTDLIADEEAAVADIKAAFA